MTMLIMMLIIMQNVSQKNKLNDVFIDFKYVCFFCNVFIYYVFKKKGETKNEENKKKNNNVNSRTRLTYTKIK
mgnify:CR=1 FL=1